MHEIFYLFLSEKKSYDNLFFNKQIYKDHPALLVLSGVLSIYSIVHTEFQAYQINPNSNLLGFCCFIIIVVVLALSAYHSIAIEKICLAVPWQFLNQQISPKTCRLQPQKERIGGNKDT